MKVNRPNGTLKRAHVIALTQHIEGGNVALATELGLKSPAGISSWRHGKSPIPQHHLNRCQSLWDELIDAPKVDVELPKPRASGTGKLIDKPKKPKAPKAPRRKRADTSAVPLTHVPGPEIRLRLQVGTRLVSICLGADGSTTIDDIPVERLLEEQEFSDLIAKEKARKQRGRERQQRALEVLNDQ